MTAIETQLKLRFPSKQHSHIIYYFENGFSHSFYGKPKKDGDFYGLHYDATWDEFSLEYRSPSEGQIRKRLNPREVEMIPEKLKRAMIKTASSGATRETPHF